MIQGSRREFLSHAVALTGAAAVGRRAMAADPAPQRMTLGFSLYGMKALKTEPAIRALREIGYDTVELCLFDGFDAEPRNISRGRRADLRRLLDDLSMSVSALMENLAIDEKKARSAENAERIKRAVEMAHDLGPVATRMIETTLGSGQWDDVKNTYVQEVGRWADLAVDANVLIAIKPHRFGAMNMPEHATWLLRQIASSAIVLAYDYSHFVHRDLTMADTIAELVPQSRFIHVKDTVMKSGNATFDLPGSSGQIDYVELLRLVKAARYRGDVCAEVSGMVSDQKGYDPLAAARFCYAKLSPAFESAGVARPVRAKPSDTTAKGKNTG